jgi:hypothetical protein
VHVALTGPPALLDSCAPDALADVALTRIDGPPTAEAIADVSADVVVAFAPDEGLPVALEQLELPALLWWPGAAPTWAGGGIAGALRRTVVGDATGSRAWRSVALPVADALFADPTPTTFADAPRAAWLGPGGPRRDEYLRFFDRAVAIADHDSEATVAVNLHDDRTAAEHRAHVALARGQLLISEPLVPSRGLEPGIDFVELSALDEIHGVVENALRAPRALRRIRLRGRRKAELFRASAVVGRLVGDLLLEIAAPAGASGR